MNRMIQLLVALLLIAILAFSASGAMIVNKYTNDFSVSSPYDSAVKACSCESRAEPIKVTNTGGFYSSYRVSVEADEPWYKVMVKEFSLAPGEDKTIMVYAEPPCDAAGQYRYTVRISSNYGRERLLTRTLDVKRCQNAYLTVTGPDKGVVCQPVTYRATLKNVAEFTDTYTLSLGKYDEYASYGEGKEFYLEPNKEKTFNITITPPCNLYGDLIVTFTVSSAKNGVTETKEMPLKIENTYDHEIVTKTRAEYCSRINSTFTFTVRNLNDIPNTYDVLVSGPSYARYEPKTLELKEHGEGDVTITLSPANGQEGSSTLHIRVLSRLGEIRKERDVELEVFDCYSFSAGYVDQPRDDEGYTDAACCGEKTYTLNIRNDGRTEETYTIDSQGPAWFRPEERTIRLSPGENRNVKIEAKLPCTDETYEFPVTVSLTKHPSIAETVLFKVDSQSQATCHAVEIKTGSVRMDEETDVVPFILRHKGLEGGAYAVHLDGELYDGVLEKEISLAPGEEKVLHFKTKANLTDYFEGKYLGTLTVTHKELGLDYKGSFWTKLTHVSLLTKEWRRVVGFNYGALPTCFWASAALVVLIIVSAIWLLVLLFGRRRTAKKGILLFARGVLIILLIGAVVWLSLAPLPEKGELYEEPIQDASGLVLQWYENEQLKLDLSKYFSDADKDSLEFTATQPAHVSVAIDGSQATLTPEHNWAGEDKIVFTASDQKGGIADSPYLSLKVLRRVHLSPMQWLKRYCHQVVLSLTIILLALFLLISLIYRYKALATTKPSKKGEKGKAVYTVVAKDGSVHKLGIPNAVPAKPKRAKPKPGQVFTYVDASGKKHVLGVAERVEWPKRRTREVARQGQAFTYVDADGRVRTFGVAEKVTWPETKVDKGATVNIAVGGAAAEKRTEFILVGAKDGNKVHDPTCMVAQRIPKRNMVSFTSKKDAVKAGYGPCKVCKSFDKA